MTMRETIHVDGVPISYLMAGKKRTGQKFCVRTP